MAACGGGSNDTIIAPTTYKFVIPAVGLQRVWTRTTIDNASNTINESYTDTVTAATATSFTRSIVDPFTKVAIAFNGVSYGITPHLETLNSSGQELSEQSLDGTTTVGGSGICTFTPNGGGVTFPTTVGATWNMTYSKKCGTNGIPQSFTNSGAVVGVESVTVPAGTFSALKILSTTTYTTSTGTNVIDNTSTWRDVNTGLVVKTFDAYSYSGTLPASGYVTQETTVLQSQK
ncbi:hypothetical protein HYN46_12805 [Aquirhabdus parva]|uniref:Lipoprotein n=1 Tax=Aquirhabdus parva TaxID=2283318 RepID=A0A345P8M3_9GAMM|nr:hypothetical protein HYN46_12805 [Aquirhabdus parva]